MSPGNGDGDNPTHTADTSSYPNTDVTTSSTTASSRTRLVHRTSSSVHYQTFPTAPPRSAGRPSSQNAARPSSAPPPSSSGSGSARPTSSGTAQSHASAHSSQHAQTPLPRVQLAVLAVIALAEQTALNSISPYLPEMAAGFPEVAEGSVGLYVGIIASAFALAQFATNFLWGWLSDRVGRKPIVLTGTLLTAACFVGFGLSRTLWQAVLVQALMGLVNGNQGVISTCLGEITDKSNQSRAFTYLPIIYGIGGITGPLMGGLLVMKKNPFSGGDNPYPYLPPNLLSAAVLLVDLVIAAVWLEESLEGVQELPPLGKRIGSMFTWLWQFTSSHRPTYLRGPLRKASGEGYAPVAGEDLAGIEEADDQEEADDEDDEDEDEGGGDGALPQLLPDSPGSLSVWQVLNRDTTLLLVTYFIFQLGNIGYNGMYPIFSEGKPPTGRAMQPRETGSTLAFAGGVSILFQAFVFGKIRGKIGNKTTYRMGLAGFVVAFLLMPWVGYEDGADGSGDPTTAGRALLWVELGGIITVKTVASVGGLTSALLLVTNSAPSHQVLGTLNGLAQTLSAAGRAVGPFVSGALFSVATNVKPKGEAMAFGIFAGVSFIGFLLSFGIRGADLEGEGWDEQSGDEEAVESDSDGTAL